MSNELIQKPAENQSPEAKEAIRRSGTVDLIEVERKPILKDKGLTWAEVEKAAAKRAKFEAEPNSSHFKLPGHAMDGMVCAIRAIEKHFGPLAFTESYEIQVNANGGRKTIPRPEMVRTPGVVFDIPGSPLKAKLHFSGPTAAIQFHGTNAHKKLMEFVYAKIEDEWKANSIYRGAVLRIGAEGQVSFVGLDVETELVFTPKVEREVAACIMSRIERRVDMRMLKIPLKTGVLLYGSYGTGKTALALKLAKMAAAHQLTYLECADPEAFPVVASMAEIYTEALILLEDVDRLIEQKGAEDMVNWIDDVSTKSLETMIIYTTNDLAKVLADMPKLIRAGRVDHLIHFPLPGVEERMRLFMLELPRLTGNIESAVQMTDGCNAAAIRQIAQRAKQMALYAGEKCDPLAAIHVNDAAESYLEYLAATSDKEPRKEPSVDVVLTELTKRSVRDVLDNRDE